MSFEIRRLVMGYEIINFQVVNNLRAHRGFNKSSNMPNDRNWSIIALKIKISFSFMHWWNSCSFPIRMNRPWSRESLMICESDSEIKGAAYLISLISKSSWSLLAFEPRETKLLYVHMCNFFKSECVLALWPLPVSIVIIHSPPAVHLWSSNLYNAFIEGLWG